MLLYGCLAHLLAMAAEPNPGRKAAVPGPIDGDGRKQLMKTQEIGSGCGPNGRIWEQHAKPGGTRLVFEENRRGGSGLARNDIGATWKRVAQRRYPEQCKADILKSDI